MNNKTILLDCDDVMLDYMGGLGPFAVTVTGKPLSSEYPNDWNMSEWLGVTYDETMDLVRAFNNTSPLFGELKAKPGAVKALQALKAAGWTLVVVTSCSADPACVKRRLANIKRVFGDIFSEVHCLELGESKKAYLERYNPSIWVEDNYKNALIGAEVGHVSVVLRCGHNAQYENDSPAAINWVKDWDEIMRSLPMLVEKLAPPVPA